MVTRTPKKQIDDTTWNHHAHVNAEHRAKIFIDAGKYKKAAEALSEIPYAHAISFLYHLGKMYLYHHDHRAEIIAKTSEIVKKDFLVKRQLSEDEQKYPHGKHVPIMKRHTISEIFKFQ